ncbi:hypothetical protein N665_0222s0018, partial [Sinapis alba]
LVTSINDELCQLQPVVYIPSKICCNGFSIKLKKVEIPTPEHENNIQNFNYFTKVLSASDTSKKDSFVLNKTYATKCLLLLVLILTYIESNCNFYVTCVSNIFLDTSQLMPSQEISAKDIHGNEWKYKHTLRGTPQTHLFTSGWNEFAKEKYLVVGDSFVFLRGDNGEPRVGIRKAVHHQQDNIPSSLISKESRHHGVVATALNAIKSKCMFLVFYKPRSSQFLVNFHKVKDGVNTKFSIGSRFLMKFEGRDFNEIRYYGTLVRVQWDEDATILRPDKVFPWEIKPLKHSSKILKSGFIKHKRQREIHEFGQEVGNSIIQSSVSYSLPPLSKPNYNEPMVQAVKETSTTTVATSYKLFGVNLTIPTKTKEYVAPVDLFKKPKISKIFEEEKVDHIQTRSYTKVRIEGALERTVDLTVYDGYNQLINEIERLFDIKGKLHMHNQWKIVFINADRDMMLLGDDPWPKFLNTAKEIVIFSKNDAKKRNEDNKFSEGDPTLTTSILPPDVNNN